MTGTLDMPDVLRVWSLSRIVKELKLPELAVHLETLARNRELLESDHPYGSDTDKEMETVLRFLLTEMCGPFGLKWSAATIRRALGWLEKHKVDDDPPATLIHIEAVQESLKDELLETSFYGLSRDRAKYYASIEEFGVNAYDAFLSARNDIVEGMRCLALEVNTAAVFHFMRVAEFGLRALARDRRIEVLNNKGREIPLDLATWEDVLKGLERSEVEIIKRPTIPAREAQLEFYHSAMMEVRRFKNVFRNRVAHTREEYDRDQALSVFNHVRDFMRILALRISETSEPLPEIWGDGEVL